MELGRCSFPALLLLSLAIACPDKTSEVSASPPSPAPPAQATEPAPPADRAVDPPEPPAAAPAESAPVVRREAAAPRVAEAKPRPSTSKPTAEQQGATPRRERPAAPSEAVAPPRSEPSAGDPVVTATPEPQPEPPPPAAPVKAATKLIVPTTDRVKIDVPAGLQRWLDADLRMQPWLNRAVKVIDGCHASSTPNAEGTITFQLTMHMNSRPDADIKSLPAKLSGVVACATGQLMRNRMPLFTGTEGESYTVKVHFSP
jgi:hypothetical protein